MQKEVEQKGRSVKPKSIITTTDAARTLGVTREHLSRVLHGHRQSRSLSSRYHLLKSKRQLAA